MNKDMIIGGGSGGGGGASSSTSSDFQLYPSSPDTQDIFRPTSQFSDVRPITTVTPQQQNPRKKRTKMMRLQNMTAIVGGSSPSTKPKYGKKPDPSAPKITRPCTECGKKFWSWKALFGHMRCHPERPWRGINPPPVAVDTTATGGSTSTNEERYVASCLLMLANGPTRIRIEEYEELSHPGWFECTSCKKVFGSHQALGGHRASHKNVKGCFAITRKEGGEEVEEGEIEGHFENINTMMTVGNISEHKCSICSRVFSSGQALGGHKRCHWEKEDEGVLTASTSQGQYRFDLNLPAPREDHSSCSNLGLDLRLGL